jgi:hypothetical protein
MYKETWKLVAAHEGGGRQSNYGPALDAMFSEVRRARTNARRTVGKLSRLPASAETLGYENMRQKSIEIVF